MKKFFTVDAHQDIAFHLDFFERDFVSPDKPCMITLPWLRDGGVRLVFNTIFVHPKHRPEKTREKALEQLKIYDEIYDSYRSEIVPVRDLNDLHSLDKSEKIGFCTLMEGADPLNSADDLETFFKKGVRILGPSWNNANIYASGPETSRGLTKNGKDLLCKANELGITLDLSHLNEKSFWEAIDITELTPIASHSNARKLTDHPRNLNDEQLLAIAERGGVTGIVFYNTFLKTGNDPPDIEDIFLHIDYIVQLCGEDHVGIGTDMDGAKIYEFPPSMNRISSLPVLAEYLIGKGYSEKRVGKIMGWNFYRVLENNFRSIP